MDDELLDLSVVGASRPPYPASQNWSDSSQRTREAIIVVSVDVFGYGYCGLKLLRNFSEAAGPRVGAVADLG